MIPASILLAAGAAKAAAEKDLSMLENLPVQDLINQLATRLAHFALQLAIAIAVFYAGKFVIRKIHDIMERILRRRNVDPSLSSFLLSMVRIVLFFILIVTVIGILGIETSSFIALFASAGVALGMALSGTLQNFAGGVLILLLKPYRVGDYIEAQGYAGTVMEIQIFSTIINTYDNKQIIVPNGPLSTGSINNWSREEYRRVDWSVSISYGDSFDTAREAILGILASEPDVLQANPDPAGPDRTPAVVLDSMAASSVDLKVRAWVPTARYWAVYYAVNRRLYTELPDKGVNFPFNQLDVHVTTLPQS